MKAPFDEWTTAWREGTPADPAALEAWQLARAWAIAERLATENPFYSARIELPAGRSADDFRSLPTTTKHEVVADCEAHPPYGSRSVAPESARRHVVETSGTSGKGREVYVLDPDDERAIFEAEAVGFWWAGARPGSTVFLTLPIGLGAAGVWYYGGLRLIGANVMPVGAYPTARKVELLARYRPEMVVGTPSYIERLASACEEAGHDPASLGVGSLMVAGEPYTLEWAHSIEVRWGARLYEQYGCTERIMGWACPDGAARDDSYGTLHVPAELAYWEVVDPDTGRQVGDGEWGEMIVTPLRAAASPLLRFATRDRVRYVGPGRCSCGRPVAGIQAGGVQRYDDMLKVRGVNVWPASFDDAILPIDGVRDYRGTVSRGADGNEIIEVAIAAAGAGDPERLLAEVRERVREATGLGVSARIAGEGEIEPVPETEYVKVRRWRDRRGDAGTRAAAAAGAGHA